MAIENIPYDVLVVLGRQRFADAIELNTSPGRGWHTARDWVSRVSSIQVMKGCKYELQQSMDLRDLWSAMVRETGSDDTSSTPSASPFSGVSDSAKIASAGAAVASNVAGSK